MIEHRIGTDESTNLGGTATNATNAPSLPRGRRPSHLPGRTGQAAGSEKTHTHEGDAIAAARRRLPTVEVDANLALIGPHGPLTLLEAFEGRRQLIAYYFMWHPGRPVRRLHHPHTRAARAEILPRAARWSHAGRLASDSPPRGAARAAAAV
jgi:Bacterial protein of unknown function (DUF899)